MVGIGGSCQRRRFRQRRREPRPISDPVVSQWPRDHRDGFQVFHRGEGCDRAVCQLSGFRQDDRLNERRPTLSPKIELRDTVHENDCVLG